VPRGSGPTCAACKRCGVARPGTRPPNSPGSWACTEAAGLRSGTDLG
jgi:hypothetical protein